MLIELGVDICRDYVLEVLTGVNMLNFDIASETTHRKLLFRVPSPKYWLKSGVFFHISYI